jgi:hypothetical protein
VDRCRRTGVEITAEGTDLELRGEEGNSSKDSLSLRIITVSIKDRIETEEETKDESKEDPNSLSKNNHIIAKMLFYFY